jgi:hypothetical protein
MTPDVRPVDTGLNCAILSIAARLFPTGYDVSDDAPSTFRGLCKHLDSGGRMTVYRGGSEATIFADNEVNYAFRAWHDWTHWRHGHDFSLAGEVLTYHQQVTDLKKIFGDSPVVQRWATLLYADIVGQRTYYEIHRDFVRDQRAFLDSFLRDPAGTLATPNL